MGMENVMKALMQSAMESQSPAAPQQSSGGGMLGQLVGGILGGGQQAAAPQQSAGGDMLSQALGGILGGGAQGANQGDQMLGMLEQVIGGRPGSGQLGMNQGAAANMGGMGGMGMNNPVMMMLQPVIGQVAAKANISPQIATVVASIAVHYLLSSHPSTSNQAPMNLGNVMQQLASSGGINQATLQKSGMVNDVVQATGLNQQDAMGSLNAVFNTLGGHVQGK